MPKRERPPLHEGATGVELFLAALGDEAGPFATTTSECTGEAEIAAAKGALARSSPLVIGADGGDRSVPDDVNDAIGLPVWEVIASHNRCETTLRFLRSLAAQHAEAWSMAVMRLNGAMSAEPGVAHRRLSRVPPTIASGWVGVETTRSASVTPFRQQA